MEKKRTVSEKENIRWERRIARKKRKPVKERGKKRERKEEKREIKRKEPGKEKKGNIQIEIKINNVMLNIENIKKDIRYRKHSFFKKAITDR